jgi:pimeloyl-ACP methyl ester carboxylesterase
VTTAEDYKSVAQEVYNVDPLKQEPPLAMGSYFRAGAMGQEYLVVRASTNPVSGFQGMAVVPVVNGAPDYSQLIVSYAGTNPDHRADAIADVVTVVGVQSGSGTQAAEALDFADEARAEAAKMNGGIPPTLSTTGHSLGGYLAMLVAAERRCASTAFNGPVPWEDLSPEAKAWLKGEFAAGRNPLTDYVNEYDIVGNSVRNWLGVMVYVKGTPLKDVLSYHDLEEAFDFDAEGAVIGAGVPGRTDQQIIANLVSKDAPALSWLLVPALSATMNALRDPGVGSTVGKLVSGLIVTVDTVAAMGMSSSILGAADALRAIKSVNAGLEEQLQQGLTGAMTAVNLFPFVTERDVLECVERNRLEVRHNLDLDAVAEVGRRVDDHIETIFQLSAGIGRAVAHATAQDMEWSQAYGDR